MSITPSQSAAADQAGADTRSLTRVEQLNRGLGLFSFALGAVETFAPKTVTRWLGVEGREGLVRAYGVREFGAGGLCLSTDYEYGAASRVVGDVVDLATLASAYRDDNPKKRNVGIALGVVAAVTVIDALATIGLKRRPAVASA
jgi:hypothetical protein